MDKLSNIIGAYKRSRYDSYLRQIDQKMKEIKKLNTEMAVLEREKDTLEYLSIDQPYSDSAVSLTSIEDKIQIIEDMMRDFGDQCFLYSGIFSHADNIRFEYQKHNKECPKWFIEKYGDILKKRVG